MNDFKEMSKVYEVISEGSYNNSREWDQQRKKQIPGLAPKSDVKNSTAMRTSLMPAGGGGNFSQARMGSGAEIANEEEIINVKGYGKMSKKDVKKLVHDIVGQVSSLELAGKYSQIVPKLELANSLVSHL
jgi:hypothetical protein